MKNATTNLIQRNGNIYFRKRIPKDIKPFIQKPEFYVSLNTKCYTTAINMSSELIYDIETQFHNLRKAMARNLQADVDKILGRTTRAINRVNGKESVLDWTKKTVKYSDGHEVTFEADHGDPVAERETVKIMADEYEYTPKPVHPRTTTSTSVEVTLRGAVDQYLHSKKSAGGIQEKTLDANKASLNTLIEYFGAERPPSEIKYQQAEEIRNALLKLPANRNKKKQYKNKTIQQLIELNCPPQSPRTVKGIIERYSSFFEWLVKSDYVDKNYFHKLRVAIPKRKESELRQRWDDSSLLTLFDSEVYTQHKLTHPYMFWLPLLALYTGSRQNEIAQLYVSDVKEVDGILLIDINEQKKHQKLKNTNSARLIPIHQHLIDLGFINYLNIRKKRNSTLLFDGLLNNLNEAPRDGLGNKAGKWFQRYRKKLNITHVDFHSFRHTVADEFKQKQVNETQAQGILGHISDSETYRRYGKDLNVRVQKETIDILDFSDVIKNITKWRLK
ncbi:MAG: site-specific integrase [Colwellia sp.]|nr:site-specific integrase [Colwellia sp.]